MGGERAGRVPHPAGGRETRPGARPDGQGAGADLATMGLPLQTLQDLDSVTIGVAVEIPRPWGEQLQTWRADFGDPQAAAIPAHITLLPPTAFPRYDLAPVLEHLRGVASEAVPFRLRLHGTGTFRPVSPVVFVRVVRGAPGCDALQQSVRTGPLVRDLAFPYHPHVTVAQNVDAGCLDRAQQTLRDFTASFRVDAFSWYEHGSDGVWRARQRFPFCSGLGDSVPIDLP